MLQVSQMMDNWPWLKVRCVSVCGVCGVCESVSVCVRACVCACVPHTVLGMLDCKFFMLKATNT